MIKAAIFDIDGTLLDTSSMWAGLGERYLQRLGIAPLEGLSDKLYRMSFDEGVSFLRREYALPYSESEITRQIRQITESFYKNEVMPKAGARELLEELGKRGVRMSIATAGDMELSRAALERLGLMVFFEGMASCKEHGGKHSPEVYCAAAELVGSAPENIIVFEDSLHAVETAKRAGFITAAVRDSGENEQQALSEAADFYCNSLSEYAVMVEKLLSCR